MSFVTIIESFRNWTFFPVAEMVSEEFRSRLLVFIFSPQKFTMNLSESLSYHSIGKLKQSKPGTRILVSVMQSIASKVCYNPTALRPVGHSRWMLISQGCTLPTLMHKYESVQVCYSIFRYCFTP